MTFRERQNNREDKNCQWLTEFKEERMDILNSQSTRELLGAVGILAGMELCPDTAIHGN